MKGYTDKPIETIKNDTFGIGSYINGLCNFILNCDTPMTISIQGDWGSGKTSMMNIIEDKIQEDVFSIWFNTWQFSQFGMSESLSICMFNNLLKELSVNEEKRLPIISSLTGIATKAFQATTLIAAEKILGETMAGKLDDIYNKNIIDDAFEILKTLKIKFQEAIDEKLEALKRNCVVIFVDDLDRLQPEKAVEILESLKMFLDCERCVFVLAVDYEVVAQGIKKKFGDSVDMRKGRSFFDKIIQLPFKMPVEQYNISKYVSDILDKMNIKYTDGDLNIYMDLIKYSIGYNPRSMKRLFNSFLLIKNIVSDPKIGLISDEWDASINKGLFSILCMQMAHEEFYKFIASNKDLIEQEFLNDMSNYEKITAQDDFIELTESCPEDELIEGSMFVKKLINALKTNSDEDLSDIDIDRFKSLLFFANMTSVSMQSLCSNENSDIEWIFRKRNREVVKMLNDHILRKYGKQFKLFTPRKASGNTKLSDSSGYIDCNPKQNISFVFEYFIKRELNNNITTVLSCAIFLKDNTNLEELIDYLGDNPLDMDINKALGTYQYMNILKSHKKNAIDIVEDFKPYIDKIIEKVKIFML